MTDYGGGVHRKRAVARAGSASASNCSVLYCGRPVSAVVESLEVPICRAHANFFQRHGSLGKRSYTAADIKPFRRQVLAWIKANETDAVVADAIRRVMTLYATARPPAVPYRPAGPLPADAARAAWEIRHVTGLYPRKVIAARLAVEMAAGADP